MYRAFTSLLIILGMAIVTPFCTAMGAAQTAFKWLLGERNIGSTAHAWNRAWARTIFQLSPVKAYREGLPNIPPGRPTVVVANHASTIDILLLLGYLPVDFRFVSKRILLRILWAMWVARYIPVDRDGSGRDWERVRRLGGELLQSGASVLLFPEGRRSRDGSLGPFKPGAFKLAIEEGVDVLPVALCNTLELMPPDVLFPRPGMVGLKVMAPLSTEGMTGADVDALALAARERVLEGMGQIRTSVDERERARRQAWRFV